jgi:hypothetical protein
LEGKLDAVGPAGPSVLRGEPLDLRALVLAQPLGVPQPQVAALLEGRVVCLLGSAHLVEGKVEVLHQVVAVEGDGHTREIFGRTG